MKIFDANYPHPNREETLTSSSFCSGSRLCNFGMAWAAVLRTKGDMSTAESLMASMTMGTMTGTRMEERTRRAEARISWFGSFRARWKVEMESRATSCRSSAYLVRYTYTSFLI